MHSTFTNNTTSSKPKRAYITKVFLFLAVLILSSGLGVTNLKAQPTKQWDKTLGGNSDDNLYSVQQTKDGGYILGGSSISSISGDKSQGSGSGYYGDFWIIKLNASGVKEWDKALGGD